MAVVIIDEPTIRLTRAEYERAMAQYKESFMFYSGTPPSFEVWYANRQSARPTCILTIGSTPDELPESK